MQFKKLIKKTLPVILSMGLSIINSEINTKQALTKNNAETQINRYSLEDYEQNWLGDIRTVNVSVAADEEFIEKYGVLWKDKVNGFIKETSDNYYSNFGIEFKIVEYLQWKSDDFSHYSGLLNDLRKIYINGDIMVAYTGQRDIIFLGMTDNNYSIVENTWPKCTVYVTMHEVGHIFELKHIPDQGSFMHPFANFCYPKFAYWDESSKQKLLKNKYKIFE